MPLLQSVKPSMGVHCLQRAAMNLLELLCPLFCDDPDAILA
jgi:hypothetical protein